MGVCPALVSGSLTSVSPETLRSPSSTFTEIFVPAASGFPFWSLTVNVKYCDPPLAMSNVAGDTSDIWVIPERSLTVFVKIVVCNSFTVEAVTVKKPGPYIPSFGNGCVNNVTVALPRSSVWSEPAIIPELALKYTVVPGSYRI
jgi:hypothetical protein